MTIKQEEVVLLFCSDKCFTKHKIIEHNQIFGMDLNQTIIHLIQFHGYRAIELEKILNDRCTHCNKTFYQELIELQ